MASKRRGGFGPPELRGTLGTLLRTTSGVVRDALERGASAGRDVLERSASAGRDVLERGASAGRARLDDVRGSRRRQDALAELGDIVLDLIRRGEIDLAELPEARALVRQLDDLDTEDAEPEPPRASSRHRFDDRAAPRAQRDDISGPSRAAHDDRARRGDGPVSSGTGPWRRRDTPAGARADDGTVSSGAADRFARPTTPARPRHTPERPAAPPSRPAARPAPPSMTDRVELDRPDFDTDDDPAPAARRPSFALPHDPHRKGGISFDDDDLNEYMHPDDVPAKSAAKDPGDGDP